MLKFPRDLYSDVRVEDVAETTEDGGMPPAGDSGIGILPGTTHDGADDESGEEA